MKYRPFGKKIDWQGSALGFGAMRLPQTSSNPADVDEAESIRMVRHAIDHGVNYVDTAYPYHVGKSELVIGKALKMATAEGQARHQDAAVEREDGGRLRQHPR